MVSNRIKFIASLINKEDKVLDIGTDHALLPIYLVKNNLCEIADGTDISNEVLKNANNNLLKYNLEKKIKLYCSYGINDIDVSNYNTFVICGMGFFTIKSILDNKKISSINKMIIQSNNNHEELRRYMNSIGYKILNDYYIMDKNKPYLILLVEKGKQKLSDKEYVCGLYNLSNNWYYKYITRKYNSILKKMPDSKKSNIEKYIKYFNSYLSKEKTEE